MCLCVCVLEGTYLSLSTMFLLAWIMASSMCIFCFNFIARYVQHKEIKPFHINTECIVFFTTDLNECSSPINALAYGSVIIIMKIMKTVSCVSNVKMEAGWIPHDIQPIYHYKIYP